MATINTNFIEGFKNIEEKLLFIATQVEENRNEIDPKFAEYLMNQLYSTKDMVDFLKKDYMLNHPEEVENLNNNDSELSL